MRIKENADRTIQDDDIGMREQRCQALLRDRKIISGKCRSHASYNYEAARCKSSWRLQVPCRDEPCRIEPSLTDPNRVLILVGVFSRQSNAVLRYASGSDRQRMGKAKEARVDRTHHLEYPPVSAWSSSPRLPYLAVCNTWGILRSPRKLCLACTRIQRVRWFVPAGGEKLGHTQRVIRSGKVTAYLSKFSLFFFNRPTPSNNSKPIIIKLASSQYC